MGNHQNILFPQEIIVASRDQSSEQIIILELVKWNVDFESMKRNWQYFFRGIKYCHVNFTLFHSRVSYNTTLAHMY